MAWPVEELDLTLCTITSKGKEALGTALATLASAHHRPVKLTAIRCDEWSVELDDTELDLSNLGRAWNIHTFVNFDEFSMNLSPNSIRDSKFN